MGLEGTLFLLFSVSVTGTLLVLAAMHWPLPLDYLLRLIGLAAEKPPPVFRSAPTTDLIDPPNSPKSDAAEDLRCTIFSPQEVAPGLNFMIQVSLHVKATAGLAAEEARQRDEGAQPRGSTALGVPLRVGETIQVRLSSNDVAIDGGTENLVWTGDVSSTSFVVRIPQDCRIALAYFRVVLLVRDAPIGSANLSIKVTPDAKDHTTIDVPLSRYRTVFMSYSTADRSEVLRHYQILRLLGVRTFLDVMSLRAGEEWERRLYEAIDESDAFLLYWSEHSAESKWVIKEAEYALKRSAERDDHRPDILPVMIAKRPPGPLPPPSLSSIHINDPVRYVILAHDAEKIHRTKVSEHLPRDSTAR
jgi:hypothetical protein